MWLFSFKVNGFGISYLTRTKTGAMARHAWSIIIPKLQIKFFKKKPAQMHIQRFHRKVRLFSAHPHSIFLLDYFPIALVPLREASQNKYGQSFQKLFVVLFDSIRTKSFCLLIYSCLFVSKIIYVMVSIMGPIFSSTKRFHVWSHFPMVDTFTHMVTSLTQISLHLIWSDAQHQCVSFGANVCAGCTHDSAQNCQIHVRIEEVENA